MSVIEVEGVKLKYETLFRAPEKDGAVVSVRVHRSVKDVLVKLAEKEGLSGVSELIRYIIAGFLIGKYKIVKPEPKVLAAPICLNINLSRSKDVDSAQMLEIKLIVESEIDDVISEAEEFISNVRRGAVRVHGNNYVKRLRDKIVRAMIKALRYNLEDKYAKLRALHDELTSVTNSV